MLTPSESGFGGAMIEHIGFLVTVCVIWRGFVSEEERRRVGCVCI